jgi:CTP synthase (UTP-ammonia lyase)
MKLALIADYCADFPPHPATLGAVLHAAAKLGIAAAAEWIGTEACKYHSASRLAGFAGIWIAPGSPYESLSGALEAIRFARENDLPLLGTCGGFQHVVLEYARNVLGFDDAAHAEYDPYASRLFISRLACSLVGKTMQVWLTSGSRAADAYGALEVQEQYYCNFGINPAVVENLFSLHSRDQWWRSGSAGASPSQGTPQRAFPTALALSGVDQNGEPRVIELPRHRFFIATLCAADALPAWPAASARHRLAASGWAVKPGKLCGLFLICGRQVW